MKLLLNVSGEQIKKKKKKSETTYVLKSNFEPDKPIKHVW